MSAVRFNPLTVKLCEVDGEFSQTEKEDEEIAEGVIVGVVFP